MHHFSKHFHSPFQTVYRNTLIRAMEEIAKFCVQGKLNGREPETDGRVCRMFGILERVGSSWNQSGTHRSPIGVITNHFGDDGHCVFVNRIIDIKALCITVSNHFQCELWFLFHAIYNGLFEPLWTDHAFNVLHGILVGTLRKVPRINHEPGRRGYLVVLSPAPSDASGVGRVVQHRVEGVGVERDLAGRAGAVDGGARADVSESADRP